MISPWIFSDIYIFFLDIWKMHWKLKILYICKEIFQVNLQTQCVTAVFQQTQYDLVFI